MFFEDPEPALLALLKSDMALINSEIYGYAADFVDHGECMLASELLVYEIGRGTYAPSAEGAELIRTAAKKMLLAPPAIPPHE